MDDVEGINRSRLGPRSKGTLSLRSLKSRPAPWRVVNSFSELAAILDANGHSLGIVERAVAGRIVAAVNMVECGHGKEG